MRKNIWVALAIAAVAVATAGSPHVSDSKAAIACWIEPNVGQADPSIAFIARGGGSTLFIGRDGSAEIAGNTIRMHLAGSRAASDEASDERLPGTSSYFIGNDRSKWRTNVPHFARVELREVLTGVDLVFRAGEAIEYDFVVKPGGDPRAIAMRFDGADEVSINDSGHLVVRAGGSELVQRIPAVYQEFRGGRQRISGGYVLRGKNEVSFDLGAFDASRPLVIDPVLVSTTQVAADATPDHIAFDSAGNVYIAGISVARQPTLGDGFIAKLNSAGTLVYISYFGGASSDWIQGVAVDSSGNAYACGTSASTDFPITGTDGQTAMAGGEDGFVLKLDSTGSSIVYAYFFGGSTADQAIAIAVNGSREVFLTGTTTSPDFPTADPLPTYMNVWVAKLDNWGRTTWMHAIGGSSFDDVSSLMLDSTGRPVITGSTSSTNFPVSSNAMQKTLAGGNDAYVALLNTNGSIAYATYWGGSGNEYAKGGGVDRDGRLYVAGATNSTDFPAAGLTSSIPKGSSDVFFMKFLLPNIVIYSGTMGGAGEEDIRDMAVDDAGCAYLTGHTTSSDFPVKDAMYPRAADYDVIVVKLAPRGEIMYSATIGGSKVDRAFAVAHQASTNTTWVGGTTTSTDFPLLSASPSGSKVAFLAKIDDGVTYSAPPRVTATATASSVQVTWTAVPGATGYVVNRHNLTSDTTTDIGAVTSYADTSVASETAYLYRVKPVNGGAQGYYSEYDLAVVFGATDDPVTATVTPVKAAHLGEVRAAIDKARALVSLFPYSYTNNAAAGTVIRSADVIETQFAINEARSALFLSRFRFTWDYVANPMILAAHMNELRQSVR